MIVGMWHGGLNYSAPYAEDAERFDSIESAKEAMRSRSNNGGYWTQDFRYIFKDEEKTLTPNAHDSYSGFMDLYFFPNDQDLDSVRELIETGPADRRLQFGPRGGIRRAGS